jgi:DNA-binding response OmpR family regulator
MGILTSDIALAAGGAVPSERSGGETRQHTNDGFVMRTASACAMLIALPRNRNPTMRHVAPLRVGDLEIDALNLRVRQGTREIRLSPGEHLLLYTLAARAGAVVSYRDIADALGRTDPEFRNNALARHLSSLRRKLADDARRPRYIETIVGIGYRLSSERAQGIKG